MTCRIWGVLCLLVSFASGVQSASFLVPSDRKLVESADAIVRGVVVDSRSEIRSGRIVTASTIDVIESLKGSVPARIQIVELGGQVGILIVGVSGSAIYAPGEEVLVFLRGEGGSFQTYDMALGKFTISGGSAKRGAEIFGWAAETLLPHSERSRDAGRFIEFVRSVLAGEEADENYLEALTDLAKGIQPNTHVPAGAYSAGTDQGPALRWNSGGSGPGFPQTFNYSGNPNASEIAAVGQAMGTWTGDLDSDIDIRTGILTNDPINADNPATADGKNTVVFNSNRTGGAIAFTYWLAANGPGNDHLFNGSIFAKILEADIAIAPGVTGPLLRSVVAHEVGHALGLRHSDRAFPGDPFSNAALMTSSVNASFNGNLQEWDREGANHLYGNGIRCFDPIVTGPSDQTVISGNSTTLSVVATGVGPINYQWYRGVSGDTASPVGTNSSSFNTGPVTTTTKFWVRVSNRCRFINSITATVTATACTPPTITDHPKSAGVTIGESATLSVVAFGTALNYEWFRGNAPDTSSGVVGTGPNFNTGPLANTTSYWVRVKNACGLVHSLTATVSVATTCVQPAIQQQPQNTNVEPGGAATLTVNTTGTSLTYAWYRGNRGDVSSGVLGTAPSFTTGPLNATTSFWVRIRNSCGAVDSNAAVVTVQAACPLPAPPQLSAQNTTSEVDRPMNIDWAVSETVDGFQIEISRDNFSTITHSFRAAGSSRSTTLIFSEPGIYLLRLFAENQCGRTEAATRLTLDITPAPARVVVAAKPSGMLQTPGESSTDSYTLINVGGSPTTLQLGQVGSFFTQSPVSFTLAPGASQIVTINAAPQPAGTYSGTSVPSGSGVTETIAVKLLVAERPAGDPNVTAGTNRVDVSGAAGQNVTGSVQFTNSGTGPVRGMIVSDVAWIIPHQQFVEIAPGATITITFTVSRSQRTTSQGSEIGVLSIVYLQGGATKTSGSIVASGNAPPPGSKSTLVTVSDTVTPPVTISGIPALGADEVAYFVPGVGHLQGFVGLFVSDVSILNTGTVSTLKDLKIYFNPGGSPPENAKQATYTEVPANKSLNLIDVTKAVFNSEQQLGTLQIRATKVAPLAINASIFNVSNAAGTYGTSLPIFRSDRSAAAQERLYLTGLRKDSSGYTHIYLQETEGGFASVNIQFLSANGTVLGSLTRDVSPYSLSQILDPLPAGAVTAVVTNTSNNAAKVLAHATPVDQLSGDTWSIADWSKQFGYSVTDPVVIPVGGKLRGGNNADFRTDVTIMNIGNSTAAGTLRYYQSGGGAIDRTLNFGPMESRVLSDVIGTLFGLQSGVGYLVFTPSSGSFAVSSRTYTLVTGQGSTFGTGVPTLSLASSLKPGEVRKIAAIQDSAPSTSTAGKPGTYRTNFGLVETLGQPALVRATMRYTTVAGAATTSGIAVADFQLQPNQLQLVPSISGAILGANRALFGELHDIQVDFEVVSETGNVMVFTTSTDNGTNDTSLRVE